MFYTGVGSRETPEHICELLTKVASKLARLGWVVRTGGAQGADEAFLAGCNGRTENFIPWNGFGSYGGVVPDLNRNWEYLQSVENVNPLIHRKETRNLDKYRGFWKLQARNVSQVLGLNLDTPSKFCILYAPTTSTGVSGGTNTAYQVAVQSGIPCFNLFDPAVVARFEKFVSE